MDWRRGAPACQQPPADRTTEKVSVMPRIVVGRTASVKEWGLQRQNSVPDLLHQRRYVASVIADASACGGRRLTMRDRRKELRESVLTTAKVGFPDRGFPILCEMHNISPSGARLLLRVPAEIHTEFSLRIAEVESEYVAEVRWLRGITLGVQIKCSSDAAAMNIPKIRSTDRWIAA